MTSFWTGTIAALVIAVAAAMALNSANMTSGQKFSTDNVRLK